MILPVIYLCISQTLLILFTMICHLQNLDHTVSQRMCLLILVFTVSLLFRARFIDAKGHRLMLPGTRDAYFLLLAMNAEGNVIQSE